MPGPPPLIQNLNQEHLYHLATDISRYHRTPWNPNPWFLDVPTLILPGDHEFSIIVSMRAVSLASRTLRYQSQSLEKAARDFYGIVLTLHSASVSRISNTKNGTADSTLPSTLLATSFLQA